MRLVISSRAVRDIEQIGDYIATSNFKAARHVIEMIETAIMQLPAHPEIGRSRDDVRPGIRMFVKSPYLIFYEVSSYTITVLRCIDGRRDPKDWM